MSLIIYIYIYIYIRNNTRPSTDPCGTPDVTQQGEDCLPSMITFCVRFVRNDCSHCSN